MVKPGDEFFSGALRERIDFFNSKSDQKVSMSIEMPSESNKRVMRAFSSIVDLHR